ncbi:glycosyl transferase, WecB/TagA/CpsF family [Chthoniobacter flavus Ellin428]|uniref:Glycosyl transferase, WecB/TagA/CpsF family n=1 Tax=Chthoniobacter flavus Ellin428 TaxID=497964 RepID=B4CTS3_9BACT|nr:WecB/TagA/CpsF family glycosyltransferase [Chthoniobacter flavus]EDY21961.1 glycosyl transferase, WecB/TagA/CpsF family [Chthoniobacter flavus Ellin428]TCO89349.1 N-acetylglucosaminyldiphosphoundecaprenol N-acetyl-beta-D-mannosaminyltransferase [Chthoniobacter flavus]
MKIERFNVLGVALHAMNLSVATEAVLEALREKRKGYVCVTGVHGVSEAQNEPAFRAILNAAFLNTTDGMPLVWLGRHVQGRWVDRVYGPDLMLEIFRATQQTAFRHFFYGGAPGVADELKARLEARFPGVTICGTYCPPFRPLNAEEEADLQRTVREARPDIIWVGLSTPKQERFMAEYLSKLDTTLMFGVGAAFDFHAGRVSQAPRWMQRSGLEWFYRLCSEPRRLGRRYLVNNPLFIWRILGQMFGLRKYPLEGVTAP